MMHIWSITVISTLAIHAGHLIKEIFYKSINLYERRDMSDMQYVHWPTSQKNTISNSEGLGIFFNKKRWLDTGQNSHPLKNRPLNHLLQYIIMLEYKGNWVKISRVQSTSFRKSWHRWAWNHKMIKKNEKRCFGGSVRISLTWVDKPNGLELSHSKDIHK